MYAVVPHERRHDVELRVHLCGVVRAAVLHPLTHTALDGRLANLSQSAVDLVAEEDKTHVAEMCVDAVRDHPRFRADELLAQVNPLLDVFHLFGSILEFLLEFPDAAAALLGCLCLCNPQVDRRNLVLDRLDVAVIGVHRALCRALSETLTGAYLLHAGGDVPVLLCLLEGRRSGEGCVKLCNLCFFRLELFFQTRNIFSENSNPLVCLVNFCLTTRLPPTVDVLLRCGFLHVERSAQLLNLLRRHRLMASRTKLRALVPLPRLCCFILFQKSLAVCDHFIALRCEHSQFSIRFVKILHHVIFVLCQRNNFLIDLPIRRRVLLDVSGTLCRKVDLKLRKGGACRLLLSVRSGETPLLLLDGGFLFLQCVELRVQSIHILDVLGDVLARLVDAGGDRLKVFVQLLPLLGGDLLPLLDGIVLILRPRHEKEILYVFEFLICGDDIHVREIPCHLKENAPLLVGLHRVCEVPENHEHLDALDVNPAGGFKYLRVLLFLGLHAVDVVVRDVARELLRRRPAFPRPFLIEILRKRHPLTVRKLHGHTCLVIQTVRPLGLRGKIRLLCHGAVDEQPADRICDCGLARPVRAVHIRIPPVEVDGHVLDAAEVLERQAQNLHVALPPHS